jgi:hypothetical protein
MTPPVRADVRASLQRFGSLPAWLSAAADPERVAAALVRHEPRLAVDRVAAKRLRLDREGTWTGRYQVTVAGPDRDARAFALLGTLYPPAAVPPADGAPATRFGTPGWRRLIPELGLELAGVPADEAALASLPLLTDPVRARAMLRRRVPAFAGLRLAGCTPRVVRSKPGNRCTILYDLAYPPGVDGPGLVVAKAYRGDKGRNAWDGMRALWASPLADGDAVTIAEPLAYLPDLGVLVQGPVGERQTLKQLVRAALADGGSGALAELDAAVDRTAAGLAALHACGVDHGGAVTVAGELAEVHGTLHALAAAVPELTDAATPLLAAVEELATREPAGPAGPAHGSFRPAQVLLDGDRVAFIDFDDACQAEPAMDLALFLSSVKGVGLVDARGDPATGRALAEARLVQLERVCRRFLDRYQALAPVSSGRVALWEALLLLGDLVQTWTKVEPAKVAPALLLLERHLERSGLA